MLSLAKQLYLFDYLCLSQTSSTKFSNLDALLLLADIGPYLVWAILFGVLLVYGAPFRILSRFNAQSWLTNPKVRQILLKITASCKAFKSIRTVSGCFQNDVL